MIKNSWKGYLLAIISIALWCGFSTSCTQKPLTQEQNAMIEKLATLKQYDMVLHKDGYIHMVAYRPGEDPENKAHWEVTLRRDYQLANDFRRYRLSTLVDDVVMIIPQDDPLWAIAAKCYLKEAKCPEVLGQ
jgi:hypothetical protein